MSDTNCPNCGAPIDLEFDKCPYCGTTWLNLANIDIENRRPMYLKLRYRDQVFIMKAYCSNCEIEHHIEPAMFVTDTFPALNYKVSENIAVNLSFESY